jgi:chorismate synthase
LDSIYSYLWRVAKSDGLKPLIEHTPPMAGNTFGRLFRLTTFGESHGPAIGGILDGCPAGLQLDTGAIQGELDRRRPGQSAIVTQRKEADTVEFYSGIFEGKSTGTPIGFVIHNTNQKSRDYSHIKDSYRPSHADYTYDEKYGFRDYRGGGRSSARETACRVVAGAIARQLLAPVSISAYVSQVGVIKLEKDYRDLDLAKTESNPVRCPDPELASKMEAYIKAVRKEGDTVGGVVSCVLQNVPVGLGEPVFDKLHAQLAGAMLSINAVKGFEYGSGFAGVAMKGSEHNDAFNSDGSTKTNFSGGIQGGISNGMDIYFNVAFKPVATLLQSYETIDKEGNPVTATGKGRHDPCVVPRAVPIVEAMAALVLADCVLLNRTVKL